MRLCNHMVCDFGVDCDQTWDMFPSLPAATPDVVFINMNMRDEG